MSWAFPGGRVAAGGRLAGPAGGAGELCRLRIPDVHGPEAAGGGRLRPDGGHGPGRRRHHLHRGTGIRVLLLRARNSIEGRYGAEPYRPCL